MANFDVSGFLQTLQQNLPKEKEQAAKGRSLEKLYLSFPDNYGKYQVFPMNSVVTGYPFAYLNGTREVKIPRKSVNQEGQEITTDTWIKILPDDAYRMLDSTGRVVSSLTAEDENLLIQARALFDQLYDELGGREKDREKNNTIGLLRKRNYTVFLAKCLNKWTLTDQRLPERTNFAALFVCTAKGFAQSISDSVTDGTITHGGDQQWLEQIYTRQQENRSGYLIFSIAMNQGGKVGYNLSITHESDRGTYLKDYKVTDEEAALMQDPVESFLGWQKGHEPGRLFNKNLMIETINTMSEQLAAVRMAKSSGMDVVNAMKSTSESAMRRQEAVATTNDPMLAQSLQAAGGGAGQPGSVVNPAAIYSQNTNPYATPPAAQIDPITQNPVQQGQPQAAPYSQPGFARPGFGGYGQPQGQSNPFEQPNPFQR
jgi:hypothetical protein